jgi:transcription antitermination protein NusB
MGARTVGREAALQMLFAIESTSASADVVIRDFWRELPPPDTEGRAFADALLREVVEKREAIDAQIVGASNNWRLERMTSVDRSILRLGTVELASHPEVPAEVIIDEAVELAKRYGADTSGKFVNGVLDKIAELTRGKDFARNKQQ